MSSKSTSKPAQTQVESKSGTKALLAERLTLPSGKVVTVGYAVDNEVALDMLRHCFDERLASLRATDAGERLRSLMQGPVTLGGKVKAGESH